MHALANSSVFIIFCSILVAILLYIVFRESPDQESSLLAKLVHALAMTSTPLHLAISGFVHFVVGTMCAVTAWFIKEGKLEMLEENLPADIYPGIAKDKMLVQQRTGAASCGSVLVTTAVVLLLTAVMQVVMAKYKHEIELRTVTSRVVGCLGMGLVMILEVVTTISVVHLDGSLLIWKDTLIDIESELYVLAPVIAFLLHATILLQASLLKFSMSDPIMKSAELSFLPNARLTPMLKSTPKLSAASSLTKRLVPGGKLATIEHPHATWDHPQATVDHRHTTPDHPLSTADHPNSSDHPKRLRFVSDKARRARILSCFVESADRVKISRKSRAKFPLTTELRCTINTLREPNGKSEVNPPQVVIHGPSTSSYQKLSNKFQKLSDMVAPPSNQDVSDQTPLIDDVFEDNDFKAADNPSTSEKQWPFSEKQGPLSEKQGPIGEKQGPLSEIQGPFIRTSVHLSMTIDFENRFDFPSLGKFDDAFLLYLNTSEEPPLTPGSFKTDISTFSGFSDSTK